MLRQRVRGYPKTEGCGGWVKSISLASGYPRTDTRCVFSYNSESITFSIPSKSRSAPDQAGKTLTEIAVTMDQMGRRQEAIDHVRRAIAKDKTSSRAHSILAGYLEEEGDLEGARREWRLAKEWAVSQSQRLYADERLKALENSRTGETEKRR